MGDFLIAQSMSRLGTESAFDVLARAAALSRSGRDIINLGIGQPDFSTPEHIVEAAIKALKDGHHGYTPASGILPLREAVAANLHARFGVESDPDDIVIVPGGKPTMFFAALILGGPDHEIIYPNPGFPIYESVIRFSGAKPVPYALTQDNQFGFTADSILSQITPRTSLIMVNSPANPTGGICSEAELRKLVNGLKDKPNIVILSDEIYSQMLYDGKAHLSLLQFPEIRDRLILLDGWSKTYAMTGWRLGYGLWPKKLVPHVTRLCINSHSCVNAASQYAGLAALTGPQDALGQMMAAFAQRRTRIVDGLNQIKGINCLMPAGAFYVFPNSEATGLSALELQNQLLEKAGVACVAGTSFGAFGEGHLRFSFANSLENIETALERIKAFFDQL